MDDDMSLPRKIQGDATDTALLRFADYMADADTTRSHHPVLYTQAFSSATKYAIKVVQQVPEAFEEEKSAMPEEDGSYIMLMKGAPDILIKRASSVFDASQNKSRPLDSQAKAAINDVQSRWSAKGQRVLLLARRYIPTSSYALESQEFADYVTSQAKDLEIVGLVGIVDPPRPEIPEVISICRQAGIKVFMVSYRRRLVPSRLLTYNSPCLSGDW